MASRKKARSRPKKPTSAPSAPQTNVVEKRAVTGVASRPKPVPEAILQPERTIDLKFFQTPFGRIVDRLFKTFASLQLALSLLTLFTISLIQATLLESWHNASVAQELVYRSWWFFGLLLLLGVNILCAALKKADPGKFFSADGLVAWGVLLAFGLLIIGMGYLPVYLLVDVASSEGDLELFKRDVLVRWGTILAIGIGAFVFMVKQGWLEPLFELVRRHWPWKRYQTGFLVTHVGLLTLVFGGLLTVLGGIEGQMELVDSADQSVQQRVGREQTGNALVLANQFDLTVHKLKGFSAASDRAEILARLRNEQARTTLLENNVEKKWRRRLEAGSFPWHETPDFRSNMTWKLRLMRGIASPRRGFESDLDDGASLRLTHYWPHAAQIPVREALDEEKSTVPAVRLSVESELFEDEWSTWIIGNPSEWPQGDVFLTMRLIDFLPVLHGRIEAQKEKSIYFEATAVDQPEFVNEFLNPPDVRAAEADRNPSPDREVGKLGQLVLFVGDSKEPHRFAVDADTLGKTFPIGDTGLTVRIIKQGSLLDRFEQLPPVGQKTIFQKLSRQQWIEILNRFPDKKEREFLLGQLVRQIRFGVPLDDEVLEKLREPTLSYLREWTSFPIVEFEIAKEDGEPEKHVVCSRLPGLSYPRHDMPLTPLAAWYHAPDGSYGLGRDFRGFVHLLKGPDGRLYYRAFDRAGYSIGKGVEMKEGLRYEMPWRPALRTTVGITKFLPTAVEETSIEPRNLTRIGADSPRDENGNPKFLPAFNGSLKVGDASHPFWLRQLSKQDALIFDEKTKSYYLVQMAGAKEKLDFEVKLRRVYETKDPGSMRSAAFRSEITIVDDKGKPEDHSLYMNHTVDHGGFRLFQANFDKTGAKDAQQRRTANLSGIQFSRDPGRRFKYSGTFIVVLGIFLMFYMKAYFFKKRGQRPREEQRVVNDVGAELAS